MRIQILTKTTGTGLKSPVLTYKIYRKYILKRPKDSYFYTVNIKHAK